MQKQAVEIDLYARASANLRRLLESVGLQRRTRDVTPTLGDYLQAAVDSDDDPAPAPGCVVERKNPAGGHPSTLDIANCTGAPTAAGDGPGGGDAI